MAWHHRLVVRCLRGAAAVVIGSLRVELQYRQMRAEKPEIEFMDSQNAIGEARAESATSPKPQTL